ncbi:hypothetical protein GCM10011534_39260 [Pseudooceanicola nanhaiensis]|uniref:Endonuclease/exonuclease/phosphatase domain-containing protein n=1 Tax=Pseudooceanicola nanhaiensis TaxID=375761 RepID=A0A917T7J2_9RHOB|nr:endonuclease/exonuclease/phosphatase family protein [Pseudooceanicola nanhaiensis]GGM13353.1 hypothetical protein GCM10011534_39260 [Pseudooceanicola nanhaiensis]
MPTIGLAEPFTVASWNIANLGAPGSELRGFDRDADDYTRIREIISSIDADVVAFQEIGSVAALEAVLPDGYSFRFEIHCYENAQKCAADADDIYNAIAIRDTFAHGFFQIDELAVPHQNECGAPARPVRGGVGVDLSVDATWCRRST